MSQVHVGFPLARGARLPKKVGGPARVMKPPVESAYLTPGQKRRRLDAAYLERFFAREQRRLATGILEADERVVIRLPSKGRVRPAIAVKLGLVANPNAAPGDPEATRYIPSAPIGNLQHSPFLARPNMPSTRWPNHVKPLISGFQYRRLWHAAHRQGLEHLLPPGPPGKAVEYAVAHAKRTAAASEHDDLIALARKHWCTTEEAARGKKEARGSEVDKVMRRFAVTLPRYGHVDNPRNLFPYHRIRMANRVGRAKRIQKALAEMPTKVAAYRKNVDEERRAAKRVAGL